MTKPRVCAKIVKILVSVASLATIAFGIWHFFIPAQWDWYSYILPEATELVIAVRAINVFFSLCLVLLGVADLLFVLVPTGRFPKLVILSASAVLWAVRCLFQIVFPQGSASPALQYGMLAGFIVIFACYAISLGLVAASHADVIADRTS